ncbi:hypothetical protein D3C85_1121380 [compost metagenome]
MGKVGNAQLAQDHDVGGVGLDGVSQEISPVMDRLSIPVDAHDVMAQPHQRLGHRTAEATEADHHNAIAFGKRKLLRKQKFSQQLDAPLDSDRACGARPGPVTPQA